jgi:LytS/YehU family sensor histidine kinase
MELNKEMEIKVLNCEIMSWFCFNHLNTPPYFLVKLSSLICLDVYTITTKVHHHLMHMHVYV